MQSRGNLIAISLLSSAAVVAMPARAASLFSTSRYSLTFPDGWQMIPPGAGSDSVLKVFSAQNPAYCYMTATTSTHPLTSQELDAYRQAYAGTDSVTTTADGTKTLGGKSYTFVEYQPVDTSSGPTRARIYYTNSGTSLFTAVLVYDPLIGAGAVPDVESALATLSLSASPIRAVAARTREGLRVADQDILGRSRLLTAHAVLFRLPIR
jgi:hypothetical protein